MECGIIATLSTGLIACFYVPVIWNTMRKLESAQDLVDELTQEHYFTCFTIVLRRAQPTTLCFICVTPRARPLQSQLRPRHAVARVALPLPPTLPPLPPTLPPLPPALPPLPPALSLWKDAQSRVGT